MQYSRKKDLKVYLIRRPHTDPWFNLAAEEFIFGKTDQDCLMLWQNQPSVIVGKHQNTLAEINYRYSKDKKIPVVRRITGGGAVYHDEGNLNFTLIFHGRSGQLIDYRKALVPILDALSALGVNAEFTGKSDLSIGGRKISGNAEHIRGNRVLHQGTLLFSSDLGRLSEALCVNPCKYTGKAIPSIRAQVTNIAAEVNNLGDMQEFRRLLEGYLIEKYQPGIIDLTPADLIPILRLMETKYLTWSWNFGYSPPYRLARTWPTSGGTMSVTLDVEGGFVQGTRFSVQEAKFQDRLDGLAGLFKGIRHCETDLKIAVARAGLPAGSVTFFMKEVLPALF